MKQMILNSWQKDETLSLVDQTQVMMQDLKLSRIKKS